MSEQLSERESGQIATDADPFGLNRKRRRARRQSIHESGYDRLILALLMLSPVLGAWLYGGIRIWSTGTLLIFTFIAGILFGIRPLIFRSAQRPVFPAALPLLVAFLGWCVFTMPFAAVPYDASFDVLRAAGLVLAFWIWSDLSSGHHQRWRWLASFILLSASIMALYALIQYNRESNLVLNLPRPEAYGDRASGAFICPNHFASYIGLVLPLALALVLCRDSGHIIIIIGIYTLIVIPPALYLTQSRSGWLATLVGLTVAGILIAARKSWRAFWLTAIIAPLAAAAICLTAWYSSPMVRERVTDMSDGNVRFMLWQDTLEMIRDVPATGFGPGSYRWVYPSYWKNLTRFQDPEYAHNEPLQAIVEYGPIGAGVLAAALITALGSLILRIRKTTRDRDAALIAGALGSAVAALIHSCFDFNLHLHSISSALVLITGLAAAALFDSRAISPIQWLSNKARRLIALATALLCLFLTIQAIRAVASDLLSRHATCAAGNLEYEKAIRSYTRAIAIAPRNHAPHQGLAAIHHTRAIWELDPAFKTAHIAAARAAYEQTLRHNPPHLEARLGLIQLKQLSGQTNEALHEMSELVARMPYHRDNLTHLASMLKEAGRREEAYQTYMRAAQLGDDPIIRANLRALQP